MLESVFIEYASTYGYSYAELKDSFSIVLEHIDESEVGVSLNRNTNQLYWFVSTSKLDFGKVERVYNVETLPPPKELIPILKKHLMNEICKEEMKQKKWNLLFYNIFGNLENISLKKISFFEYMWNDRLFLITMDDYDVGFNFYITHTSKRGEKFYFVSGERNANEIEQIRQQLVIWFNEIDKRS
ncbi:MAG: hypothetical protein MJZ34_05235 [Paludibacteraceae bacterium]|nr:hypothetical protein [Paludibacteraceae bacterium]